MKNLDEFYTSLGVSNIKTISADELMHIYSQHISTLPTDGLEHSDYERLFKKYFDTMIHANPSDSIKLLTASDRGYDRYITNLDNNLQAYINIQDDQGFTAMHYAAYRGHFNIVKLLVEAGASTSNLTRNNKSVLILALQIPLSTTESQKQNKINTIRYLVSIAPELTAFKDSDSNNLAHHICVSGLPLLDLCNENQLISKNGFGVYPIHKAILNNQIDIVTELMDNYPNEMWILKDKNKQNILHYAAKMGNISMIKACYSLDASLAIDNFGKTPLDYVIQDKLQDAINFFIDHDPRIDLNDNLNIMDNHLSSNIDKKI